MATTYKTRLKITIALQSVNKPKIHSNQSDAVQITYKADTMTYLDGVLDGKSNQFPKGLPTNPSLEVKNDAENEVWWDLTGQSAGNWTEGTYVVGIVIEAGDPHQVINHPGGLAFGLDPGVTREVYVPSLWAGPSGLDAGIYRPYLYEFKGTIGKLGVKKELFFDSNGFVKPRTVTGPKAVVQYSFNYRIYFYSQEVGIWWVDPSVDVRPPSSTNPIEPPTP